MKELLEITLEQKPYIIAIPTYSREKIIFERTLKTLYECNVKSELIHLFLASKKEEEKYLNIFHTQLEDVRYKKWLSKLKYIIGVLGLKNQRNFISDFYLEGQHIIQMDDDIQDLYFLKWNSNNIKNKKEWFLESFRTRLIFNKTRLTNKTKKLISKSFGGFLQTNIKINKTVNPKSKIYKNTKNNAKNNTKNNAKNNTNILSNQISKLQLQLQYPSSLHNLFISTFKYCVLNKIYLWGIYPVENAWFMSSYPTTDLRFIVGPCFGIINRRLGNLKLTLDEKENVERTLQYWSNDGIVLRLNNITLRTQYYKVPGGMQTEGKSRKTEALKSAEILHSRYPNITKIYLGKKSGHPELKLIKNVK
jgi:hypothetical protein